MSVDVGVGVEKYNVSDGQAVVVTVPVPENMNFHEVQDHLGELAKAFKVEFDRTGKRDVNLFVFPINPDGLAPRFEVIPPLEEGSTVILHVPVGGLDRKEVPAYLKTVRDTFLVGWDVKFPGVNLELFGILDGGEEVKVSVR